MGTFTAMAQVPSLLRGTKIPQAMWDGLITKKVTKMTITLEKTKEKTINWTFNYHQNLKLFIKDIVIRVKGNPQNGRKYLQVVYMIKKLISG